MHVFVLESVRDFYNFRVNHAQFYVNGNTDKATRCIAICIAIRVFHITIYRKTLFGVSLHPYVILFHFEFVKFRKFVLEICVLEIGLTIDTNFDYHDSITITETTITILSLSWHSIMILSRYYQVFSPMILKHG